MKRKSAMRIHIARAAYVSSMKNMAAKEETLPRKAVCQLKNLKPGLKLGADPTLRKKHARFMTKNVIYIVVSNC
jgi:hypothetical protein